MSSALLAKLKIKPVAKAQEAVEIAIPKAAKQEAVVIQTKIVDKTKESGIDRESLLAAIKTNPNFKGVVTTRAAEPPPSRFVPSLVTRAEVPKSEKKSRRRITIVEEAEPESKPAVEEAEAEAEAEQIPPELQELKPSIRRIISGADLSQLTSKGIRKQLETEFGRDLSQNKTFIADTIKSILAEQQEIKAAAKKTTRRLKLIPEGVEESKGAEESKAEPKEGEAITIRRKTQAKPELTLVSRKTVRPSEIVEEYPDTMVMIGDTILKERLPVQRPTIRLQASEYYMNNRQIFVNFITSLFTPYKQSLIDDKREFKCEDSGEKEFSLLSHQNIVRDYLNLYTPYRGLLLFHGLGSGKTCSSIAIAEGMKSAKQIVVMTPASLRKNYMEELKKCGDPLYKKNQFWEFVSTTERPELEVTLAGVLSLPLRIIKAQRGAWLVNVKKRSNYETLSNENKVSLDSQLTEMIHSKYKFVNYNGLRKSNFSKLTTVNGQNPFDNTVVIVDEAHNFISRIVNKLNQPSSVSYQLYELLMQASNVKIVLLTGTPIINYPNELAILFNILRGKIMSWTFKLNITSEKKFTQETIKALFARNRLANALLDDVQYKSSTATLSVTRNPFGFVPKYDASRNYEGLREMRVDERGNFSDEDFIRLITKLLKEAGADVNPSNITTNAFKALPDKQDEFNLFFIDQHHQLQNTELFKRRILGLTSYFRSIEELMPEYVKSRDFQVIKVPMSEHQLAVYETFRSVERDLEQRNKVKKARANKVNELYEDAKSSYRIFSRVSCNFAFPTEIPRPMPKADESVEEALQEGVDEDLLDALSVKERVDDIDGRFEPDDDEALKREEAKVEDTSYKSRIERAFRMLWDGRSRYLSPEGLRIHSPKFLNILENITDESHRGLHLIYSQFRTLEGIAVLKLILEANGYAQFKIKKLGDVWQLETNPEDIGKPKFALYTGTEDTEEKEIIRNIFNSSWKYVPSTIVERLQAISSNNMYGEIVKVLMITSAGAEGISLRNVRYVHLTESYWHPVRLEQVIGRARRICSHTDLPPDMQNVKVYLYLSSFNQEMLAGDGFRELKLKDVSRIHRDVPITSDEHLYESSIIKEDINQQLLKLVKESAIDCNLNTNESDGLRCFAFGSSNPNNFSYLPALTDETRDEAARVNVVETTWKAREVTIDKVLYALNPLTNEVYDLDSYKAKAPIKVGRLEQVTDAAGKKKIKFVRV